MQKETKIAIAVGIVFAICLYYMMAGYCKQAEVKVTYYYSPTCPHCSNFMKEWGMFSDQMISSGECETYSVNCSEDAALCAAVTGVPHVVFSDDVGEVVYPGERTAAGMTTFLRKFKSRY
jgi:hypothetical protein